jgi:phosphohistidine phosphatase
MKKLILVRHGKAEVEAHGISDFERSLTTSGKKISKRMAHIFIEKEESPGLLISSPAFRAIETALIFAGERGTGYDKMITDIRLYDNTDLEKVKMILTEKGDDIDTVTLFGHNPSFSEIANGLSKNGCDFIPKSGIVCITFNVKSWAAIKPKTGKPEYFLKP